MVRLLAASVLLLLLLSPETAGAERYCGSDTPLDTPYFAPFQQTREEAVGCWAAPPAAEPPACGAALSATPTFSRGGGEGDDEEEEELVAV